MGKRNSSSGEEAVRLESLMDLNESLKGVKGELESVKGKLESLHRDDPRPLVGPAATDVKINSVIATVDHSQDDTVGHGGRGGKDEVTEGGGKAS